METAAALFRERGFDKVSVADLMHAAGLTHGGFYNHFGSKDDLEAAACAHVFEKSVSAVETIAAIAEPRQTRRSVWRLQAQLRLAQGPRRDGGALPDGRFRRRRVAPVAARPRGICGRLHRYLEAFERAAAGAKAARAGQSRQQAIVQLAALAGALTLARSVAEADPALSDEILEAAVAALDSSAG